MNGSRVLGFVVLVFLMTVPGGLSAAYNTTQVIAGTDSPFLVTNYQQSPDRIYPGDQVTLKLTLTPKSDLSDATITANTPLYATDSIFSLGNINRNDSRTVTLAFTVSSTTKAGTYPVYVYSTDKYNPEKDVARVQLVINTPANPGLLVASAHTETPLKTGDAANLTIILTNTGTLEAEDVIVDIVSNQSSVFTALGADRQFVGILQGGKTVAVPFEAGISASAAPGYYPLVVTLRYSVDNVPQAAVTQQLGLKIEAKAELLITSDQQRSATGGNTLTLNIANVGDTAVRGVYAIAQSNDFRIVGSSDKFIGTLNLDDSSTLALTLVPAGGFNGANNQGPMASQDGIVNVQVTYKDASNQEHTLNQEITVSSSGFANTGTVGSDGGAPNQRFLRTRQNDGYFGLSLVQWGLIAAGLLIVGFFGYKWYKKRTGTKR